MVLDRTRQVSVGAIGGPEDLLAFKPTELTLLAASMPGAYIVASMYNLLSSMSTSDGNGRDWPDRILWKSGKDQLSSASIGEDEKACLQ